ncbi:MAG: phytanoyl-CoA dioxygenase family protein [Nitratireductor sp.]|nr:phytanoyl-CoA dioxygenase family protein [Nitratireductor sp.]
MLTPEQKQFFDVKGYLVVEDVLDQKTVLYPVRREYSALLDGLYDDWVATGRISVPAGEQDFYAKLLQAYRAGCDWFQPMDISLPGDRIMADTPMHFGPAIFDLVTNNRLLDLVEDLIGPEITSNPIQHVRIKPPANDLRKDEIRAHITATDWHQDRGVTHDEADNTTMITVWCAVTDATIDNGCLQVVPREPDISILPHCPKKQTAIADGFIDEESAIPLPVKSGGVVIFHPLTPHASLTNKTDGFRWSFDLRYNVTGEPTGRSHFPGFVARSRSNPQSELHDWRAWRAMWEEARARLAVAPHINIHRWMSDAPYCA